MIVATILFKCNVEGQDVKMSFGIHHFWIQHTHIDLKNHGYRFSPHFHPTSLMIQAIFFKNGPCLYFLIAIVIG